MPVTPHPSTRRHFGATNPFIAEADATHIAQQAFLNSAAEDKQHGTYSPTFRVQAQAAADAIAAEDNPHTLPALLAVARTFPGTIRDNAHAVYVIVAALQGQFDTAQAVLDGALKESPRHRLLSVLSRGFRECIPHEIAQLALVGAYLAMEETAG